ncbi:hypothetical protein ACQJBY_037539 [Aegilops geniculata]
MAYQQMWAMRVLVMAIVLIGVPWGAVCVPAGRGDAEAMQAIAKSIGWAVPSSDPCDGTWTGVSCNEIARVTSIVVTHAGLHGVLNGSDVGKLTFLSNLDLSFNRLIGHLPLLPTPHQHLRTIDLSSNSLTRIPRGFFAALPALEAIAIDNNDMLVIWDQRDLVTCSALRSFSANNASVYDNFPNFFGDVALFPALERLSLARNRMSGAVGTGFGANSNIRYLDVGGQRNDPDKITGRLDLFIPDMVNLVEAHLDHSGFFGPLPDVTKLVNLRVFDASYNDLCGRPKFAPGTAVTLDGNPNVGFAC